MSQQDHEDTMVERTAERVAPIFRLLGEGRLGREALDAVVAVLEADGLPTISEARLARACRIAHRPREMGRPSPLRRLVAALVLDLRPGALTAGVRSIGSAGRQLLFTADPYEVLVQESANSRRGRHLVMGQILRDGDPVPRATVLLDGASQRAETEADPEGGFRFLGVADGSYQLDVWAGDDLIVCGPVVLHEQVTRPLWS